LPFNTGLTLTTARYYTPYGVLCNATTRAVRFTITTRATTKPKRNPAPGQRNLEAPLALARRLRIRTQDRRPDCGGRVFYGGGGITPDIEIKEPSTRRLKLRIAEAAFHFTRDLAAGSFPVSSRIRSIRCSTARTRSRQTFRLRIASSRRFAISCARSRCFELQPAQIDEELDFAKLRLRQEIITAAFSSDAGARVLLDSDTQVLRAVGRIAGTGSVWRILLATASGKDSLGLHLTRSCPAMKSLLITAALILSALSFVARAQEPSLKPTMSEPRAETFQAALIGNRIQHDLLPLTSIFAEPTRSRGGIWMTRFGRIIHLAASGR
jgi:hypothetical protein